MTSTEAKLDIESNFHINRFVVSANFLFSYPCECDSPALVGSIVSIDIRSDGLHVSINFNNYATNMFIMRYIQTESMGDISKYVLIGYGTLTVPTFMNT